MTSPQEGPVVTNEDGQSISMRAAPVHRIVYVNNLAMVVIHSVGLGFSSDASRRVMGDKAVLDAKMRSATRVRLT